ncbi:hypothetical protein BDN70DRAFT_820710, partial [Pholiota conissans]
DFINVKSILETDACEKEFQVIFLPKFYCELNSIKQCWGYAKCNYQIMEPSLSEEVLEKNVVKCLNEIPLITMHW